MFQTRIVTAVFFPILMSACAGPAPAPDPGFEVIEYDRVGEIQVAAGLDRGSMDKVLLAPATVEFRQDWVEDQRRKYDNTVREQDQQRIKAELSKALDQLIFRELTENGYTVTTESGADTVLFRPRIVDLDIYLPARSKSYIGFSMADSKGRMKIELDVFDPVSGDLLLTSWRNLSDPQDGVLELTDSASNQRAFYLMMRRWADWLFEALDNLRE